METKYKNKKLDGNSIHKALGTNDNDGYRESIEETSEELTTFFKSHQVSIVEPLETKTEPKKKKVFKVFTVNNGKY